MLHLERCLRRSSDPALRSLPTFLDLGDVRAHIGVGIASFSTSETAPGGWISLLNVWSQWRSMASRAAMGAFEPENACAEPSGREKLKALRSSSSSKASSFARRTGMARGTCGLPQSH